MKKLSLALLTIFTLNNVGVGVAFADANGGSNTTEESACFEALSAAVKNSSKFGGVNLSSVKKTKSGSISSHSFDVSTYSKFLKIANTPAPKYNRSSKVKYFPTEMSAVAVSDKGDARKIYKANRTNIGTIMYTDNKTTSIDGHDGKKHSIKGYFVDTKIVTFGEANQFKFPVPSRDSKATSKFPYGSSYDDMREYLLYTHHLSDSAESGRSKQFLSCGIVHINPQGKYKDKHNKISNNNYKGNVFDGSNYQTKTVIKNGKKFRQGDVLIQTVDPTYKALEKNVVGSEFAQFDVITMAYDNNSLFLNEYETLELQKDAMANPADQTKGMAGVIKQFYESIPTKFKIKSGVKVSKEDQIDDASSASISKNLQASIVGKEGETVGGLAMYDGVDFDTIQAVDKIRDPSLRAYMQINLVPGYKEVYQQEDPADLSDFEKNYVSCDLTREERIENVQYLIEKKNKSGRALNPRKLEYKDPKFGFCGIPFMDLRERAFLETSPLSNALNETVASEKQKLLVIEKEISATVDLKMKKKLERKKDKLTIELQDKLQSIRNTQVEYRTCAREKLFLESDLSNGKITQAQFDLKKVLSEQRCQYALRESAAVGLSQNKVNEILSYVKKPTEEVVKVAEKMEARNPELTKPAARSEVLQAKTGLYKLAGIIAFILAAFLISKLVLRKKEASE